MSANVPRVAGTTTAGTIAATQLPNTGPGETVVLVAAFTVIVLASWYLADRVFNRA